MSLFSKYFFFLGFIALSSVAFGQAASTPFSTFGVGEPYGNALIQNLGMGGTGVSQPQFWSINNQNPALLVYNYSTFFQAGVVMESRTLRSDTMSQKSVNGNLNYLVTSFAIKPGRWTTSVGLMPYTNINYKLQYLEPVIDNSTNLPVDTVSIVEQGSGGLSQLYWSNGVRIHPDFTIGAKISYIFGSAISDYSNLLYTISQPVPFIIAVNEQAYVKDFIFGGGLSFSKDSLGKKEDYRLSVGLTYNFASDLRTRKTTVVERRLSTGDPIASDTLVRNNGYISIPSSLTFGVSLSKGTRWSGGAEFSMQDWSQFKSLSDEDEGLVKAWRVSAGGEITPDPLALESYLKRMTYRMGFSYEKNPFLVNNKELKDFGINFGFSMPTGRSSLDWAFRIGKRGDKSENVLEETYYKVYFGITFNDQWFVRRRFD